MNYQLMKEKYDGKTKYEIYGDEDTKKEFLEDLVATINEHVELYRKRGIPVKVSTYGGERALVDVMVTCKPPNCKLKPHQRGITCALRVVPDNSIMDIENEIVYTVNFIGFDDEWTNFDGALEIFDKIFKKIS